MALRTIHEWASDNQIELSTYGHQQDTEANTLYDEDLVTQQVNGWLQKLTGLCSTVPMEDRPELVEQIVKSIRQQLLK
jgi:hypothetical protein